VIRFFVAGLPKSMKVSGVARFMKHGRPQMVPKRGNDAWALLVGKIGRDHGPDRPLTGPIIFTARFFLPRPKSLPRSVVLPLKRPDWDNLVHKITDQWNGVFWVDDSQIVDGHVFRRFAPNGRPGVEIVIEEFSPDQVQAELLSARHG
jgi:Holliday junction resolvase RusA-like endonuclease